jgi:hypothetical protein
MKAYFSFLILLFLIVTSIITQAQDPNFHIYLAFGQSNMEGAGAIESQDRIGIDARFQVIGALDCTGDHTHQLGKWTTAAPPLVRCRTGLGVSDYFGRTMVQELPAGIKIGIVPVAVGGSDIALFDKVNYASYVESAPSWMKDIISSYGGNPYGRLVEVAKLAQKDGVIKGIIFHQGETNTNNPEWKNKVADIVKNLKTDLQLGDIPFLAGELLASPGSCCGSHNVEVNKLPSLIPNAHVVSSADLVGADAAHFNPASYREFGKRYAKKMIEVLRLSTCTPPTITPYVQINGGSWQQTATISVTQGGSVKFGPQPVAGGSWSWSGPNNFSATTREVTISNIQMAQAGNYIATYTDASGCRNTQTFNIAIAGTAIVVRARGTQGTETIELRANNTTLATWTLTTAYQNYSVTGSGTISVHFTNDNGTRDVQIDYITIAGTTYQAENQATNTGVWMNNTCGGSNSEWINCNGYIDFTTASGTNGRLNVGAVEVRMSEDNSASSVDAYPNPVVDRITINLPGEMKAASIKVISMSGNVLMRQKASGTSHLLDMSQLPAGFYLIRASEGAKNLTLKVVKR